MMRGGPGGSTTANGGGEAEGAHGNDELLGMLVESLMQSAEHPPNEVQGVSDEFIEQLDRVPKKSLKEEQSCPICSNPFLEGKTSYVLPDIGM